MLLHLEPIFTCTYVLVHLGEEGCLGLNDMRDVELEHLDFFHNLEY
jgi:hypothetical protein